MDIDTGIATDDRAAVAYALGQVLADRSALSRKAAGMLRADVG